MAEQDGQQGKTGHITIRRSGVDIEEGSNLEGLGGSPLGVFLDAAAQVAADAPTEVEDTPMAQGARADLLAQHRQETLAMLPADERKIFVQEHPDWDVLDPNAQQWVKGEAAKRRKNTADMLGNPDEFLIPTADNDSNIIGTILNDRFIPGFGEPPEERELTGQDVLPGDGTAAATEPQEDVDESSWFNDPPEDFGLGTVPELFIAFTDGHGHTYKPVSDMLPLETGVMFDEYMADGRKFQHFIPYSQIEQVVACGDTSVPELKPEDVQAADDMRSLAAWVVTNLPDQLEEGVPVWVAIAHILDTMPDRVGVRIEMANQLVDRFRNIAETTDTNISDVAKTWAKANITYFTNVIGNRGDLG